MRIKRPTHFLFRILKDWVIRGKDATSGTRSAAIFWWNLIFESVWLNIKWLAANSTLKRDPGTGGAFIPMDRGGWLCYFYNYIPSWRVRVHVKYSLPEAMQMSYIRGKYSLLVKSKASEFHYRIPGKAVGFLMYGCLLCSKVEVGVSEKTVQSHSFILLGRHGPP